MAHIKLGYAPTRRSIFSAPDAIKYRGLTRDRLAELGISFVDIDDMGALIVEDASGLRETLSTGEISLRLASQDEAGG
mgnify:CR=1 FL=1